MALTTDALAHRILKAIEASGWSQNSLAEAVGLDASALSKALSSKRNFKPLEVALIADKLGVPVQDLLATSEQEPESGVGRCAGAARQQPGRRRGAFPGGADT